MKTSLAIKRRPWPKIRLRWGRILALFVLLPLLLAYVGSYWYLSRRGIREAKTYNMFGFLYVSMKEGDFSQHERLARFYAPANWVDRTFFHGEGPMLCILSGLSVET